MSIDEILLLAIICLGAVAWYADNQCTPAYNQGVEDGFTHHNSTEYERALTGSTNWIEGNYNAGYIKGYEKYKIFEQGENKER